MTADPEAEIRGVSYDSRSTAQGDLFTAIVGTVSNRTNNINITFFIVVSRLFYFRNL